VGGDGELAATQKEGKLFPEPMFNLCNGSICDKLLQPKKSYENNVLPDVSINI